MQRSECQWRGGHAGLGKREWHGNGRAGRVRFFRRIAAVIFIFFLLGVWGLISLGWRIFGGLFRLSPSGASLWVPVGTLLVAFLVALALLRTLRRVGLPFREVMDAAECVAEGDYRVRVAERGPPPMQGLARSFNTMTERLARHEQLRRNLMADIAHELRTPLTIIQGKLEGLLDGVYPREDAQLAEILDETTLLSRLIEDLRTLTLSETGTLKLEKEPVDVIELARDVVHAFSDEASSRQAVLAVDAPPGPLILAIDAVRIRQVLHNLLCNALQHSPPGGSIQTRVRVTSTSEIVVDVHDTGNGMTQDQLDQAFERFQKGPGSRGSGLGLTIARSLVLAHGGEMRAISQLGQGTTISFTLPSEAPK